MSLGALPIPPNLGTTLFANLALVLLDLVTLGVLALALHWSSRRFGLAPLLIFVSGLVLFLPPRAAGEEDAHRPLNRLGG